MINSTENSEVLFSLVDHLKMVKKFNSSSALISTMAASEDA